MTDNHVADGGKKDTMSLTLALIVLDRLNTSERIDVARDNLAEAVRVVSAAAQFRIKRKLVGNKEGGLECSTCGTTIDYAPNCEEHFCYNCGQALDWGGV